MTDADNSYPKDIHFSQLSETDLGVLFAGLGLVKKAALLEDDTFAKSYEKISGQLLSHFSYDERMYLLKDAGIDI